MGYESLVPGEAYRFTDQIVLIGGGIVQGHYGQGRGAPPGLSIPG